jgi:hypothetical protein
MKPEVNFAKCAFAKDSAYFVKLYTSLWHFIVL